MDKSAAGTAEAASKLRVRLVRQSDFAGLREVSAVELRGFPDRRLIPGAGTKAGRSVISML